MKKDEFIAEIADRTGMTKKQSKEALEASLELIKETVAEEGSLGFKGFGTFKLSERAARTGRNPQTGKKIKIAASKAITFKMSSTLKGEL